jgi:predicted O-methyltransferase YrrM
MSAIEGWLTDKEGLFLAAISKNKVVLEIGSYKGKSTNFIAPVARKIFCVDLFMADTSGLITQHDEHKTLNAFIENTKKFNNVFPLIGNSAEVAEIIGNSLVDVLFIDGDHTYEGVSADYNNYVYKVKPSGCIVFHDYTHSPHVKRFVDEVYGKPDLLVDSIAYVKMCR